MAMYWWVKASDDGTKLSGMIKIDPKGKVPDMIKSKMATRQAEATQQIRDDIIGGLSLTE